jgi:hypothetical protein
MAVSSLVILSFLLPVHTAPTTAPVNATRHGRTGFRSGGLAAATGQARRATSTNLSDEAAPAHLAPATATACGTPRPSIGPPGPIAPGNKSPSALGTPPPARAHLSAAHWPLAVLPCYVTYMHARARLRPVLSFVPSDHRATPAQKRPGGEEYLVLLPCVLIARATCLPDNHWTTGHGRIPDTWPGPRNTEREQKRLCLPGDWVWSRDARALRLLYPRSQAPHVRIAGRGHVYTTPRGAARGIR